MKLYEAWKNDTRIVIRSTTETGETSEISCDNIGEAALLLRVVAEAIAYNDTPFTIAETTPRC